MPSPIRKIENPNQNTQNPSPNRNKIEKLLLPCVIEVKIMQKIENIDIPVPKIISTYIDILSFFILSHRGII